MKSRQQAWILVFVLSFMMISVGMLSGCTSNNTNTDTIVDDTSLISAADENILSEASSYYHTLLHNASAQQARVQLVEKLNTQYPEVESAELGVDNYTIFITYSDGAFTYIDTFDYNESNEQPSETGYAVFNGYSNDGSPDDYAISFDGPSSPRISFDAASPKTTAQSKKVLILGPCYYEFPQTINYWTQTILSFQSHGWSQDDITVKIVDKNASGDIQYGNIKPEDYYNLGQYGIILFDGHGAVRKNHEEDNLYLQYYFLSNLSLREDPALKQQILEWNKEKKLAFGKGQDGLDEGRWAYWWPMLIRADLLRELIVGKFPSSYVYLATCYGVYFNRVFRDKGAAVVVGYNNPVSAIVSDSNMAVMTTELLDNGKSVYQAYLNNSVMKKSKCMGLEALLKIYPDPADFPTADEYYFPAWFDPINVTGIPSTADVVTVTLYNGAGINVKSKSYPVSSDSLTIDDLGETLFLATGTPIVEVKALDSSGKELAVGRATGAVSAGANSADISLSGNEDRKHVEYTYDMDYNITIDLELSSDTWEVGKEVTATATCTCQPVGNAPFYSVTGFQFILQGATGQVVAHDPPFPGADYGFVKNGSQAMVDWGSPTVAGYGSPATFHATFRLVSKEKDQPYIEARFSLWSSAVDFARIYLK